MAFILKGVRFLFNNIPDDYEALMNANVPMRKFDGVVDPRSWGCCAFARHQHLIELMTDRTYRNTNEKIRLDKKRVSQTKTLPSKSVAYNKYMEASSVSPQEQSSTLQGYVNTTEFSNDSNIDIEIKLGHKEEENFLANKEKHCLSCSGATKNRNIGTNLPAVQIHHKGNLDFNHRHNVRQLNFQIEEILAREHRNVQKIRKLKECSINCRQSLRRAPMLDSNQAARAQDLNTERCNCPRSEQVLCRSERKRQKYKNKQ